MAHMENEEMCLATSVLILGNHYLAWRRSYVRCAPWWQVPVVVCAHVISRAHNWVGTKVRSAGHSSGM